MKMGSTDFANTYYKGAVDGKVNEDLKTGLANFLKDVQTKAKEYKGTKNGIFGADTEAAIAAHKDETDSFFKAANEILPSLGYLNTTKDASQNTLYRQFLTAEQLRAPDLKPAKPVVLDVAKTPAADLKKAALAKVKILRPKTSL